MANLDYSPVNYKVRADFNADGSITPVKIKWFDRNGDAHNFNITRVLDVCNGASLKLGVAGLRYTVEFGGRQTFLYLCDNKWYLES